MPRRNRVDPFGDIRAVRQRGDLMGNRGILHDSRGQITRTHAHRNWVCCVLGFKDRRRPIMAPNRYTELFFLDEATAFAAGHRPCAECRRAHYQDFARAWCAAQGPVPESFCLRDWIDGPLHAARRVGRGKAAHQRRHHATLRDLPDGTMVALEAGPALIWEGAPHLWSFDGYGPPLCVVARVVPVLTPAPVVAAFRAGYAPQVAL